MTIEAPQQQQQVRTYEIGFDQPEGLKINQIQNPEEKRIALEKFSTYISSQLETTLGERFNVGLSLFEYEVIDGQMWGKDMNEPFINSLKRGRDYRKTHGKEVDWEREDAEVVGFEKIQETLLDSETQVGTMMLSISQKGKEGSTYQHNFYDIFTLRERDGVRYVEARRYASSLGSGDYYDKLQVFGTAEELLANPMQIPYGLTPEDVHAYLHKDFNFMEDNEFSVIKSQCKSLIDAYTQSLVEEPGNDYLHRILFNAIINKADDVAERVRRGDYNYELPLFIDINQEVERYGFQPVQEVNTGCGSLGGYDVRITSPFGVVEYTSDAYGERSFNCPTCKKENIRPVNQLLAKCLHCGSSEVSC